MTSLEKQTTPSRFKAFLHKKQTYAYMLLLLTLLNCSKSIKNTPGAEHKSTKKIEQKDEKKDEKTTTTDLWDIDLSDDNENDAPPEENDEEKKTEKTEPKPDTDKEEASEPHFEHTSNQKTFRQPLGLLTHKLRGGNFTDTHAREETYHRNENVGTVTISIYEETTEKWLISWKTKIWMDNAKAIEGIAVGEHVLRPTQGDPIELEYTMHPNPKRGKTTFKINTAFPNKNEFLNFLKILLSKVTS